MSQRIEINITGDLPKGPNGSHGHWAKKARDRKMWRALVESKCIGKNPLRPFTVCAIEITRFCKRKLDYDNFVASCKPVVDGLIDGKIIADDSDKIVIERKYIQEINKIIGLKIVVVGE